MIAHALVWLKRQPGTLLLGFSVVAISFLLVSCGGSSTTLGPNAGTVTVSISDPPSCAAPAGAANMAPGSFSSVFVTIVSVKAHITATADANSPGWQELAPQLNSAPMQVDLLNLPNGGQCLLATLGSAQLPVGDYQQIRLILLANAATSNQPSTNACASLGNVFNCVQNSTGLHTLDLSSEAQTGLKIPPGQIMGGPIHVAAGQSVDLNIDFDACSSIVAGGNGMFRLKPTLTAGVVSPNLTGISGQVVDSVTGQAIAGATVALESPDATGIDRIAAAPKVTDATGHFRFCPLPAQAFDIVIDAITSSGTAYDATIVFNVTGGVDLGPIPLVAETPATAGASTGPGTIAGIVTALNGATPPAGANIDVTLGALQTVTGHTFTVPLFPNSTPSVTVSSSTPCPKMGSPAGAFCATYSLVVPASNPEVGTFSAGKVTFTAPASGDVLYSVEADATNPTTQAAICSPSSITISKDSSAPPMPLKVMPGATTNAAEIDFSGCS